MRRYAAEFVGTFLLVFAGCGAIVVDSTRGGVTHVGVALTFGLVVLALVYTLGDASGAHLNPAVSLSLAVAGRFPPSRVAGYVAAQCLGATAAALFLRAMFPDHATLGATSPSGGVGQSWWFEFLLTLFLLLAVLGVTSGGEIKGAFAGVAVGAVIALEALFAGPVCGASMNPARSLGPALVAGATDHLWLYLTAPVAGGLAGVAVWQLIRPIPEPTEPKPDATRPSAP